MREILFRGKDKFGDWHEGNLIHQTQYYGDPVDLYHIVSVGEFYYENYLHDTVIPETVGQFTGLTDKNGKRIFEGDVVDIDIGHLKRRGFVFYEDTGAKFGVMIGTEKNFSFLGRQMVKMYNVTVNGNIHDQPELLKSE